MSVKKSTPWWLSAPALTLFTALLLVPLLPQRGHPQQVVSSVMMLPENVFNNAYSSTNI